MLAAVLSCVCVLQDMLKSFAGSEFATQFHQTYYLQLLREVLAVMTDTFHTPGFKLHCKILLHLFGIVRGETIIKAPLWDVAVRGHGTSVGRCKVGVAFILTNGSLLCVLTVPYPFCLWRWA